MRIDRRIEIAGYAGLGCGVVFLIIYLMTFMPLFLWLMVSAWVIAGVLGGWRTIRGKVRSLQQQERNQPQVTSKTRMWSILKGIFFILIAVGMSIGTQNIQVWWLHLIIDPFIAGPFCFGIALIIQGVKPKRIYRA